MPAPDLRSGRGRGAGPSAAARAVLDAAKAEEARRVLRAWPGYRPTPLVELPGLAERLGVASVVAKDESGRFGIGSFKALGGAFAVMRTLQDEIERRTGERPSPEALAAGHPEAAGITTATASAGNHGRSVAWGSQRFGCRCVVVLPAEAQEARARAIESHGARVVRFDGPYDEAVAHVEREAARNGWLVVSDTAYEGYEEVPRRVMEGYTILAEEWLDACEAEGREPPSHVFVQAGVGGLATGLCGGLWHRLGERRPRFVAVEPWRADCFGRSLRAGALREAPGPFETAMGGLAAGVPSTLAWTFLRECLDGAVAIPEGAWREAADALEGGELGVSIEAGPSGAAGVGALLALARMPGLGRCLAPGARVGALITEARF